MTTSNPTKSPFQLKGSQFTLPILLLHNPDTKSFLAQLSDVIEANINFFNKAPLVIDLQEINDDDVEIDVESHCQQLKNLSVVPVAIRNGNQAQMQMAEAAGLGIMNDHKEPLAVQEANKTPQTEAKPKTKIITQPIRSGQQVYAKDSDLIIIASVSPGAEVLADGNIHIYGALRGRALAGVSGDQDVRIFCKQLEAEMVSIAGIYRLQDDLTHDRTASHFVVHLEKTNEQLAISQI